MIKLCPTWDLSLNNLVGEFQGTTGSPETPDMTMN
jgi:hypothetical protein